MIFCAFHFSDSLSTLQTWRRDGKEYYRNEIKGAYTHTHTHTEPSSKKKEKTTKINVADDVVDVAYFSVSLHTTYTTTTMSKKLTTHTQTHQSRNSWKNKRRASVGKTAAILYYC